MDPTTTVLDAGARYGMHPTWRGFGGELRYLAFEPDQDEAARLRAQPQPEGWELSEEALADAPGWRDLHVTAHRGYCSFRPPDLAATWFHVYRPDEGLVERTVKVSCTTIDHVARERRVQVDFLKLDTEGTELEVLRGGASELERHVLGARVEVNFERTFQGQALFGDVHALLERHGFALLNLDYAGRGVPQHLLHRQPDPQLPDHERFGRLVATDGVWMKPWPSLPRSEGAAAAVRVLKYAAFAFQNHAADVALDALARHRREMGPFPEAVQAMRLHRWVRRRTVEHLGRWRVHPGPDWVLAASLARELFGVELGSGHRYWETVQAL